MPAKTKSTPVVGSMRSVWLAGLGAVATVEEEGGKLFHDLVQRGKRFEKRIATPLDAPGQKVRQTVGKMKTQTGSTMGKIESAVDDGIDSALKLLGLSGKADLSSLTDRIEALSRTVLGAESKKVPRAKPRSKRRPAARTGVKKAATKTKTKAPRRKTPVKKRSTRVA